MQEDQTFDIENNEQEKNKVENDDFFTIPTPLQLKVFKVNKQFVRFFQNQTVQNLKNDEEEARGLLNDLSTNDISANISTLNDTFDSNDADTYDLKVSEIEQINTNDLDEKKLNFGCIGDTLNSKLKNNNVYDFFIKIPSFPSLEVLKNNKDFSHLFQMNKVSSHASDDNNISTCPLTMELLESIFNRDIKQASDLSKTFDLEKNDVE